MTAEDRVRCDRNLGAAMGDVGREIGRMANVLHALEDVLLATGQGAGRTKRPAPYLADLDVLIQTADELSRYVGRMAAAIDPVLTLDLCKTLEAVRLGTLRIGLGGQTSDVRSHGCGDDLIPHPAGAGSVDLF